MPRRELQIPILALLVSGAISCADLDSFIEPEPVRLPALPADSCGEYLADVVGYFGMAWSSDEQEIFLETENSIRAIRRSDKSVRTVVGSLNWPRIVRVTSGGQKIYFTAPNPQTWQYSLMSVSPSGGTAILILQDAYSVLVSSDGQIAAYSVSDSVFAMNLGTTAKRFLRSGYPIAISEDGSFVVIRSNPPPNFNEELHVVSTATSSAQIINPALNLGEFIQRFVWIGGNLYAYTSLFSNGYEFFLRNLSTGQVTLICRFAPGETFQNLIISDNGGHVGWWEVRCASPGVAGICDFYEMRLHARPAGAAKDTTLARAYSRYSTYPGLMEFSADGTKIAFVVKSKLYAVGG